MVELSNEMLETYGMTRYKSITIKDDPEALRFTRQCLEADQRGARKIKEVTDDGGEWSPLITSFRAKTRT